jgi:hypothetical protein
VSGADDFTIAAEFRSDSIVSNWDVKWLAKFEHYLAISHTTPSGELVEPKDETLVGSSIRHNKPWVSGPTQSITEILPFAIPLHKCDVIPSRLNAAALWCGDNDARNRAPAGFRPS